MGALPDDGSCHYAEYTNDPSVFLNPKTVIPFDVKTPHDDPNMLKFLRSLKEDYFDANKDDKFQRKKLKHELTQEHFFFF